MKKFLIFFGIFLVFISASYFIYSKYLKSSSDRILTSNLNSPSQAIEQVVKSNIKSSYWPQTFSPTKDDSDLARYGFGKKYADNYSLRWSKSGSHFIVFVGYNKKNEEFIGYAINIYLPNNYPNDIVSLPKEFINNVPEGNWKQSGPKDFGDYKSQVANIVWRNKSDKSFLEIASISYKNPSSNVFINEKVKDSSLIRFLLYTPNSPEFTLVEEFQESAHSAYHLN